jgi:hypothetical protein
MKMTLITGAFTAALLATTSAYATGMATCDSGPRESWQSQEKLEKMLLERGWKIRRIKEDGGCFEVYAFDEKGERVEAYFHPKTLNLVPTSRYPRKS